MKPLARQWVDKAEADYAAANTLRRSRKRFTRDIVCFHLQQCIEKYLKAILIELDQKFPRTHDLEHLLELISKVQPLLAVYRPIVASLTDFAVEVRYPGRTTTPAEARSMLKSTAKLRKVFREYLLLPAN